MEHCINVEVILCSSFVSTGEHTNVFAFFNLWRGETRGKEVFPQNRSESAKGTDKNRMTEHIKYIQKQNSVTVIVVKPILYW